MSNKVISASQAAALIKDGSTLAASAFGLAGWAEEVAIAIKERFLETGHPKDLTIVHATAIGDHKEKGMHHLGYEGLVKRWIGGHVGAAPSMAKIIEENKIEAYNLPQGVIVQLYREIASGRPGLITKVGMGTFVDPRLEGGKMSDKTKEDIVKVVELEGEEWLFYKTFPIDVALIRGTVADENGNLTMDKEGLLMEALPLAQATKNSGGIVIAQVEYVAQAKSLHPKKIKVPGILVDYIVVAKPENHFQTQQTLYNPSFSGDVKVPLEGIPRLPLDERKVIARRCAMELIPGAIINLGVGMPTGVSSVAAEEGVSEQMILTTEAGTIGGVPGGGLDFGHSYNAEAIIEHHSQFDFYDGGGLDITFLGLAQADKYGNVNVSKFGTRVTGCGGFINISQCAKKVVYCGTFTAGGLKVEVSDGKLKIIQEGKYKKFLEQVQQVTFSGSFADEIGQDVLYVTERAVFKLLDGQLTLIEVAPGIDPERDIFPNMGFKPNISPQLKEMPVEIFQSEWGKLKQIIKRKGDK